jgi:hypothetical protein
MPLSLCFWVDFVTFMFSPLVVDGMDSKKTLRLDTKVTSSRELNDGVHGLNINASYIKL